MRRKLCNRGTTMTIGISKITVNKTSIKKNKPYKFRSDMSDG